MAILLLFARSYLAHSQTSRMEWRFTTFSSSAWHATALFSAATRSRRMKVVGFDPGGTYQEGQKQVPKDLLLNPSGCWDNSLDQTTPRLKLTRKSSSLNNQCKPMLADPGQGTMDAGLQGRFAGEDKFSSVEVARACEDIRSLCKDGQVDRALDVMDQQGTVLAVEAYTAVLKACMKRKALAQAQRVYAHLVRHGLDTTRFLGEFMVSTLVKCGSFHDALQLFDRLPEKTVFSWTALISGYTSLGQVQEALNVYCVMKGEGVKPNAYTFVSLLKACGSCSDLEVVNHMHTEALRYGCATDVFVGTCLVDMYAKCGSILDAQSVFDGLTARNVVSWTAIIAAYAHQGQAEKVVWMYRQMQEDGISPDERTIVSVLQACAQLGEKEFEVHGESSRVNFLETGRAIHADACRKGYHSDIFVGSSLVSMYARCGSFVEAESVLFGVSHENVVAWTVILMAYVQQGQPEKALQLYQQMQEKGATPDARAFVSVLQTCGMLAEKEGAVELEDSTIKVQSLEKGRAMHAAARRKGFDSDLFVGNTLISMYGKCGSSLDAQCVFDGLSQRDIVSWNAILSAYVEQGQADTALKLYERMCSEGEIPDSRTFVMTIQACGMLAEIEKSVNVDRQFIKVNSLVKGRTVHAYASSTSYASDTFINNTLASMYGTCGSILDAEAVFNGLLESTVVSWNAMLAAYVQQDKAEKALQIYERMVVEGISRNVCTFVSVLQACAMLAEKDEIANGQLKVKSLVLGKAIHADACETGCQSDAFLSSTLIGMYGKCGSSIDAQYVFHGLSRNSVVAWTALLGAYVQNGQAVKALELYEQMPAQGVSPDVWSYVIALQACGMLAENADVVNGQSVIELALEKGRAIHADAQRKGCECDVFIGNTLISMYGKCGSIVDAQKVFDGLLQRDVVSWNAMLSAHVEQGHAEKALQLYEQMQEEGVGATVRTFVSALRACCMLAAKDDVVVNQQYPTLSLLEKGRAIHTRARQEGCDSNVFVGNTLISMYGKCGKIVDAEDVFHGLLQRNVLSWNVMLAICNQQGQSEKVLELYKQMEVESVSLDETATICILQACSNTGGLDVCRQIHGNLIRKPIKWSLLLANTLINTYGRCGSMADAQTLFDALLQPDVVSWTALIAGYARQGNHSASLRCYEELQLAGIKPDRVTCLSILSACSHAGLVDKGVECFEAMIRDHDISPEVEHFVSMVDLLGRAGYFTEVEDLLSSMPVPPNLALWLCLLGACRKHGKVVLGQRAFDCARRLQPEHSAAYFLMSTIYADAGLWDHAMTVKDSRQSLWKKPGCSWIEHEHDLRTFVAGSCKHIQRDHVLDLIRRKDLLSSLG